MPCHLPQLQIAEIEDRFLIGQAGDLRMMTRIFGWHSPERPIEKLQRTCREHAAIIEALEAHDPEGARRTMAEHIRRGCKGALTAYDNRRMVEADVPPAALREALREMESEDAENS